jgi:oxygen-dependent protoporphyrinogen oxidase
LLRPPSPTGTDVSQIENLGLEDELLLTSKNSDAAKNRFIYYPDHLVKMPGPGQDLYSMIWTVLTEPLFKGAFRAMLELTRDPRSRDIEDESIASFLSRRFGGPEIGDNIVSAVMHGIYAGDIYKLSAKSLFRMFWDFEVKHGSIMEGTGAMWNDKLINAKKEREAGLSKGISSQTEGSLQERMKGASVFTFKEGIGQLSSGLEASLRTNPNVEFKTGDKVISVEYDAENNGISVRIPHSSLGKS